MSRNAEVVICGAGIAGAAAAWYLSTHHGVRDICIIEEGAPLSLTSDKSTECYRNWWPGQDRTMVDFTNRSIDLLEQLAAAHPERIAMNRRGYVFATADAARLQSLKDDAARVSAFGAGELREHTGSACSYSPHQPGGWDAGTSGMDVLADPALVQRYFPAMSEQTLGLLHVRRCGWLSAQQLGSVMLESARAAGATLMSGRLSAVDTTGGRVRGVTVQTSSGGSTVVGTDKLLLCPGPYLGQAARLLGVDLPVSCERHVKIALRDTHNAMPADAPMLSWMDPVDLPWSDDEREALAADPQGRKLLQTYPAGVHGRPTGKPGHHYALLLWTFDIEPAEPEFPIEWDPNLPEIIVRGLSAMLPGMRAYFDPLPRMRVDGGYYCKTPENRPLIGPLPVAGAYVSAAYSGYGIMASCAGAELAAAHLCEAPMPDYAGAYLPSRFDDPAYLQAFAGQAQAGQL